MYHTVIPGAKQKGARMLTPKEFQEYHEEVFQDGAKKHGTDSWLKGENFNKRGNDMSMLRHYWKSAMLDETYDLESKLFHLQHLATRALMEVHRLKGKVG